MFVGGVFDWVGLADWGGGDVLLHVRLCILELPCRVDVDESMFRMEGWYAFV